MRSYLTDRFFALFGLCQLLGTFSLIEHRLLIPYLLTWPAAILILWLDWRTMPGKKDFVFSMDFPHKIESGRSIVIKLTIKTRKLYLRRQKIILQLPKSNLLRFDVPTIEMVITSNRTITKNLIAKAATLGFEEWYSLDVSAFSYLRSWVREIPADIATNQFRVFPIRSKTSPQVFTEIARNQRVFQTGSRRILRGREASQFHSIRDYQYPDSIRYIDAKKTARYQRLMTRVYDSLLTHQLVIGLDVGRSLMGEIAGSAKHDYYISACLALTENALQSHDKVSFFAFSQRVHHLIRATQKFGPFLSLYRGAPELSPREEESNYNTFVSGIQQLAPQRSLVLLLTDFSKPSVQNSLLPALSVLSQKHLVVVAGVIDQNFDLTDSILDFSGDLDSNKYSHLLYNYWLDERIRSFQFQAAKFGVGTVLVHEKDWMNVVIRLYSLMRTSIRM